MHPKIQERIRRAFSAFTRKPYDFSFQSYLAVLEYYRFAPKVCIYVGASEWAFDLREVFPESFHVLVGPAHRLAPQFEAMFCEHQGMIAAQAPLDTVVLEAELCGPFFLMADTQGNALDVIRGASEILPETEVVVLSASLSPSHGDTNSLHETTALMGGLGYVTHGIFPGYGPRNDGALAHLDVAFVKKSSVFRAQPRVHYKSL